jgi:hypothetical protein
MIEQSIIERLLATSAVTAIVGTRIHPGSVPQGGALPALVLNKISGKPLYADDGEVGLDSGRFQLDSWATTYTGAKELNAAVRSALSAWFDDDSSLYSELDVERDLREGGSNASEYLFRVSADYLILHRS